MEFTASELLDILGGELKGNPSVTVNTLSKIEEGKEHSLAFLASKKYIEHIYSTQASLVLLDKELAENANFDKIPKELTLIILENPRGAFAKILEHVHKLKNSKKGQHSTCYIDSTSKVSPETYVGANASIGAHTEIGNECYIHANVAIGDKVKIGKNTIIYQGVVIYDETIIGDNCVIQSGAIIGGDGFGFAPNQENNFQKIYHLGNVVIEDHVEIGSNTTIDKATMGSTVIKKGAKLDNLIQVAHNVEIGENTVIAAQSGIAGSTKIGKNCMIGGQVGIVGHLTITDNVKIAAQSGIGRDISENGLIVQGSPSFNISDYKKSYVVFRKLPQLQRTIDSIIEKLDVQ